MKSRGWRCLAFPNEIRYLKDFKKGEKMTQKWAVITGATSGIGWATAEAFAKQGYNIFGIGRREERLAELEKALKKTNTDIHFKSAVLDITDRAAMKAMIDQNQSVWSQVEVLVNNAGLAKGVEKVQDANPDDWETMIDTNVKGLLFMTRAILPFMTQKNSGHIINLGSVAGRWTYPGGAVYCATKFAVRALSEGLRMDLLGKKIRITNIEPGMVNTEFSLVRLGDQNQADKVYEGMTPLSAQDIAETITWCALRPAHVNIQELVIYPTDQAHIGQVARPGLV
jgi:NADP-dependent 3-hydroxy acid dehydrogenase YdfG